MSERNLEIYQTRRGKEPFTEWYDALRDVKTQARIRNRLRRVEAGNLGDCKSVGAGVSELRLDFGPGYRVYFGEVGDRVILLLCAGDKSTQDRDIVRAQAFFSEYRESK
ncbi:MAG: type II toxin-antitoxin system RelE/ParE family toxin [Candidatus Latescibacteria bacterium]|jgi:putative addiction module killer protein|nr:type II toxin-antitoxin system RelE/ParE family toxin [Candidatus Latescibacterota bacterium]MBT4140180.1 type II toxin-antitoxin system RelE/ParE family toxin [Candidatus Latescibacterota bacterium]